MDILDTRPNLTSMVLCHDQQIKDLAAHLLELKQLITPMMEFKRRPWVGLTDAEIKEIVGPYGDTPIKGYTRKLFDQINAKLKELNT